jgi:hypothetical protein
MSRRTPCSGIHRGAGGCSGGEVEGAAGVEPAGVPSGVPHSDGVFAALSTTLAAALAAALGMALADTLAAALTSVLNDPSAPAAARLRRFVFRCGGTPVASPTRSSSPSMFCV